MNKTTWIILAVLGGSAALCCLGSAVVLLFVGQDEETVTTASTASGGEGDGLVGTWMNGSASLTEYRDIATGTFAPPSGTGILLELRAGGGCTQSAVMQSTLYSCTSWIFTHYDDCSWSLDGDTLTLELTGGTLRSRMCGGEVEEGQAKDQVRRSRAQVATEEGWTWLTLTDEDGSVLRYRRQ